MEEEKAAEEEEEEEAGDNEGAASNPTHNWGCSIVHNAELEEMVKDGAIPPSLVSAWRADLDDPFPTPIQDEQVRGFLCLLPHSPLLCLMCEYTCEKNDLMRISEEDLSK